MKRRSFLKLIGWVSATSLVPINLNAKTEKEKIIKTKIPPKEILKIKDSKNNEFSISAQITCKCKKFQNWITEETITSPCPNCGRRYIAKFEEGLFKIKEYNGK